MRVSVLMKGRDPAAPRRLSAFGSLAMASLISFVDEQNVSELRTNKSPDQSIILYRLYCTTKYDTLRDLRHRRRPDAYFSDNSTIKLTMPTTKCPTPPGINICAGGYDGTVAGLSLRADEEDLLSLTANFAYSAHIGAVRSAALLGSTLVTGGADETIRIYDLAKKVERGTLFQHNGTVNALHFARDGPRNLLLSAGDDAAICVWQVTDWRCLKRLSGHQAAVLDVAVHPSARVALSVSKDRSLYMWNMLRGKVAFSAKTKGGAASCVGWAPGGEKYFLVCGKTVTLSTVEGRDVSTFAHGWEVLAATCLDDDCLATAGEEKFVRVWDARTPKKSVVACRHGSRVKDVAFVDSLLLSADSCGGVKVWDVRVADRPRLETSVGGGDMRLTSMTAASEVRDAGMLTKEDDDEEGDGEKRKAKSSSAKLEGTASQRKRKKRKKQE